jgi:hypothetical protein
MLPTAVPTVIFQKLDEGAVLFAPASELYFGLNEVGVVIWDLLPPKCASLDLLCAIVAARYPDVPFATIQADVTELLDQLVADGLARYVDPRPTDAAAAS